MVFEIARLERHFLSPMAETFDEMKFLITQGKFAKPQHKTVKKTLAAAKADPEKGVCNHFELHIYYDLQAFDDALDCIINYSSQPSSTASLQLEWRFLTQTAVAEEIH